MRAPLQPQSFDALIARLGSSRALASRLPRILTAVGRPTVGTRYRHWHKLRFLQPPADLDHEEWWLGLKLARIPLLRELPLRDRTGAPFKFAMVDPAIELLHEIDSDARGQIAIPVSGLHERDRDRYVMSFLMEEAITSSQLEGASTTRRVAKDLLRSGRRPVSNSERMIANNHRAIQWLRERTRKPLTTAFVLELHQLMTEGTLDEPEAAGRFRRHDENLVVGSLDRQQIVHTPPAATELPARMREMCDFANRKTPDFFVHPVVRAAVLHFWLAYDHPFVDGNGRTARALFYWSMLSQGYWLCEFLAISQVIKRAPSRYSRAFLYTELDDNDLTYFVLFHLQTIKHAIRALHEHLEVKVRESAALTKILARSTELNHRQVTLLGHALRHDDAEYTFVSHATSHVVAVETARKDLLELERRGLLTRAKAGRAFVFHPAAQLEARLQRLR